VTFSDSRPRATSPDAAIATRTAKVQWRFVRSFYSFFLFGSGLPRLAGIVETNEQE
jgi:hypothetical protein